METDQDVRAAVHRGNGAEPPAIEHARRGGWAALAISLLFMIGWRFGDRDGWMLGFAVGFGIAGLLAVANIALLRAFYRRLDAINRGPGDAP